MLEIAVCDDDLEDLNTIKNMLEDVLDERHTEYNITSCTSSEELLNETKQFDICILDIVLGKQNGIDLGKKIKERFPEIHLLYTTGFEQYVMRAVNEVHAHSYLCKPINKTELDRQLSDLLGRFSEEIPLKDFFNVTDRQNKQHAVVRLNIKDILYFEYIKRQRRVAIVLENEVYEYGGSFAKTAEEFAPYDFAINRRGCLVNLRHIVKIKGYVVFLDNGTKLHISQRRIGEFRKSLNDFLQKKF